MTEKSHIWVPVEMLKTLIERQYEMVDAVNELLSYIDTYPEGQEVFGQLGLGFTPNDPGRLVPVDPDGPPAHLAAHDLLAERQQAAWGGITIDQFGTHYVTVPDGPEAA